MALAGRACIALSGLLLIYSVISLIRSNQSGSYNAQARGFLGYRISVVSLTVSCLILLVLLLKKDFSVAYVASYSSIDLPFWYTLSAFWAGQEGSLLLWAWMISVFGAILIGRRQASRDAPLTSSVIAISLVEIGFLVMLLQAASPFLRLDIARLDGAGLNPLLQNPAMVIHPPLVFLGYGGFAVTFALVIGSLISGDPRSEWVRRAHKWALFSWLTLTLGIILGARWAYDELGWGGYWSWDPVENSSLIPWLVGTAFVHSLAVERAKGMLKMPTVLLSVFTFVLCVFGTFLTRSGIISSVHAFAESPIGYYFLGIMFLSLAGASWLIIYRADYLTRGDARFGPVSKENSVIIFNLVLLVLGAVVLFGTCYPLLTQLTIGRQIALDRSFFDRSTGALGVLILLLVGTCSRLSWGQPRSRFSLKQLVFPFVLLAVGALLPLFLRHVSPGFIMTCALSGFAVGAVLGLFADAFRAARRQGKSLLGSLLGLFTVRKHGSYLIHLGVVLMALGLSASSIFKTDEKAVLDINDSMTVGGYELKYVNLDDRTVRNRYEVVAKLEVYTEGRSLGYMMPAKAYYPGEERPMSEVSVRSGFLSDLYVAFGDLSEDGTVAIEAHVNLMVKWIWIGGYLLFAGAIIAMKPAFTRVKTRTEGRG